MVMKKFSIRKMIAKGIKGAIYTGGSGTAMLIASGAGLDDIEEKVAALTSALIGLCFEMLRNWIKNRDL